MGGQITSSHLFLMKDLYNDIEALKIDELDSYINNNVKLLSSFCFSEIFPYVLISEGDIFLYQFWDVISIYERKEKFLSLKIYFTFI